MPKKYLIMAEISSDDNEMKMLKRRLKNPDGKFRFIQTSLEILLIDFL